jgi:hypothetical protein
MANGQLQQQHQQASLAHQWQQQQQGAVMQTA